MKKLLDLCSSMWTGVVLLTLIFVYSSLGSAGQYLSPDGWRLLRQHPWLEMTEYEWFQSWPFTTLVALLALAMIAATYRRVGFNRIQFGTWLVHGGLLMMILACWHYFSTKIEGDTPVIRRQVQITVPGHAPRTLAVLPNSRIVIGEGAGRYQFRVASIQPDWPILSGKDKGKKAYSVSVEVKSPSLPTFVRQFLVGYPEYTEDIIPGAGRLVKQTGERLTKTPITMKLAYEPQAYYYLSKSTALYFREVGATDWVMRPIEGLPRYHEYVSSTENISGLKKNFPRRPLRLPVASVGENPLEKEPVTVRGFLPYAHFVNSWKDGGDKLNPVALLRFTSTEFAPTDVTLEAMTEGKDAVARGMVSFRWVNSLAEMDRYKKPSPPRLTITVKDQNIKKVLTTIEISEAQKDKELADKDGFVPIADSDYRFKIEAIPNQLVVANERVSMVIVKIKRGDTILTRWVFSDPQKNRDVTDTEKKHTAKAVLRDPNITFRYAPGSVETPIIILAGPSKIGAHLVISQGLKPAIFRSLPLGVPVKISAAAAVTLTALYPHAKRATLQVVPPDRRTPSLMGTNLLGKLQIEIGGERHWLPYFRYVFPDSQYAYRSLNSPPTILSLADGRQVEVLFSRVRQKLPNPVVLDDFILQAHTGGYAPDESLSIRDWISKLKFVTPTGFSEVLTIKTNSPTTYGGLFYYQAEWDSPGDGSSGLNYTGLGVGNRNSVVWMLLGCCIAAAGMIYAFYIKPVLLTRRKSSRQEILPDPPLGAPESELLVGNLRVVVLVGFALGLMTLVMIVMYGMRKSGIRKEPSAFAKAVKLDALSHTAVHADGRLKSFQSFSAELMGYVNGSHKIDGQSAAFTYFDLMFRPKAYRNRDYIYLKNKQMRQQIKAILDQQINTPEEENRLALLPLTGLISPQWLFNPAVQLLLQAQRQDVRRTARLVGAVDTALGVSQPEYLGHALRIMPPPKGDDKTRWLSPHEAWGHAATGDGHDHAAHAENSSAAEAAAKAACKHNENGDPNHQCNHDEKGKDATGDNCCNKSPDAIARMAKSQNTVHLVAGLDRTLGLELKSTWDALAMGWRAEDAVLVNAALQKLARLLPQVNPTLYPDHNRIGWESWYFKNGHMTWVWMIYMVSVILFLLALVYGWSAARRGGMIVFLIAFALHTFTFGLRWYVSSRFPNSNMFEAITTATWFGGCLAIPLEWFLRRSAMRNVVALASAGASLVALMAVHYLPADLSPHIGNMMPILHNVWLYIHVNVVIFSYCLIAMAALTSTLYLLTRMCGAPPDYARFGGTGALMEMRAQSTGTSRMSSASLVFDGVTMLLMELSFVLLWTGIFMGAIWADHSWGRPWGWDPKEVFALNTFIVYIILVHVRMRTRDKGLWTALLSIVGCGVMLFNWIVVNFVITGLHSYA